MEFNNFPPFSQFASNLTFRFLILIFLFAPLFSFSQEKKKVKLIHTDELLYDEELVDAQRLIGNVHLEYEGTQFYCDSAYLFANDDFDAFSRIRIVDGANYNVTGDFMHFDKATKTSTLRSNITLRDKDMTLTTNDLTYNLDTEVASYFGGGKIVSNVNRNTLTSDKGYYHSKIQTFYFRKKVVLTNPEYVVKCDTMQYNNSTEITYFFGPTTINGDKTSIYCENGYYNSKKDQSRFGKNAQVTSETTVLKGDSIFYDGKKGLGEVFRNVTIQDTTNNYIIAGDYGRHLEASKQSFVTGRALMTQIFDNDSLFMHADTLKSFPDTSGHDVVYAFHHVKLFKHDLQGKCDSLVYSQQDSTLRMYNSPVLWSSQNQVTGDTLLLQSANGKLEKLYVKSNAYIISDAEAKGDSISEPSGKYNQIKGRKMTGYFTDNDLSSVYVEGNGQLIYFPTDDKGEHPKAMGHNKGECSNINITVKENQLTRIRMETETNSTFTPMKLSDKETFLLDNFKWRGDERPMVMEDIFIETEDASSSSPQPSSSRR